MKNQASYDPPGSMHGKGRPGLEPARAQGPAAGRTETQDAIRGVVGELRQIEERMVELCESLPEPGDEFEPLAELCGVVDCVNHDLIADAIRTLELAASHDEAELRRQYEQRQRWLAAPRRFDDALL